MSKNFLKRNYAGFTIIEMLVAILIFSVSLLSLLVVAGRGLQANRDSDNLVRANFLALEAIEIVRNSRDNYFLTTSGSDWGADIAGCPIADSGTASTKCQINLSGGDSLSVCSDCTVKISADNMYGSVGENTQFRREISLQKVSDNELFVNVDVIWQRRDGSDRTFNLQENLRLWR